MAVRKGTGNQRWDTSKTNKLTVEGGGTKTPTGDRPVVTAGADTPPAATVPGATKAPVGHTAMPTPNKDRLTGAPKQEGGGSY